MMWAWSVTRSSTAPHSRGLGNTCPHSEKGRFPAVKSLDTFDFAVIPSLNKMLVLELSRCEYIVRRENVIALGNSGTGKSHIGLALGLAACQRGFTVGFTTAAGGPSAVGGP